MTTTNMIFYIIPFKHRLVIIHYYCHTNKYARMLNIWGRGEEREKRYMAGENEDYIKLTQILQ